MRGPRLRERLYAGVSAGEMERWKTWFVDAVTGWLLHGFDNFIIAGSQLEILLIG